MKQNLDNINNKNIFEELNEALTNLDKLKVNLNDR